MTIALTGANGQFGRIVVAGLKETLAAKDVVGLVRTPEKAADLGITLRQADYDKPETLAPALVGIDTLLLISGSDIGKRVAQHKAVIDAAKAAGVRHIIYTSLLNADASTLSLADEHRETEAMIKASGIAYTILRNGWYTENYTMSVPYAVKGGAVLGAAGEGRISAATRADFAAAAVAVLSAGDHVGKTYELAGDRAFTLADLAAEVSKQVGKPIPYKNLPAEDYAKILGSMGLPEGLAAAIADFDISASTGALYYEGSDLSRLIGRPTTPLSAAVKAALA